jgi:hypothetical protein
MPLSWNEIKSRALAFSKHWSDACNEAAEAKPFLIAFFEIFGITDKRIASFEHAVKKYGGAAGFVDLFWPGILLVEMKSRGKNLDRAYAQAMDYFPGIAERDLPRFILVCDFARFRLFDLVTNQVHEFNIADLHKNVRLFGFIAGYQTQVIKPQDPINIKAAERMGRLHDQLKAIGYEGRPLEMYLVRLLFCLFAEDTSIFEKRLFQDYIEQRTGVDGSDLAHHLATLFHVLNTPTAKRLKNLDESLAAFPYVNGKLFESTLPPASFDAAMRESLLDLCGLDWSLISPAIFGSLFQSIMDTKARRNLGAHYTSEENILKLIKPLFLDGLWAEFEKIRKNKNRLFEFHKKLRSLSFFDPACGCGNFLVITYRELRLLELEVLRAAYSGGQMALDIHQLINVDVDQFFGIEIEDFPAQIAQVALWLVDHQMNIKVSEEFGAYFVRIPLVHSATIVHGNALQLDWSGILPALQCAYVLGNPPFIGKQHQSPEQKADVAPLFDRIVGGGVLDFVAAWYIKGADYARQNPALKVGFVSTSSIVQGEQVGTLWQWMRLQGMRTHFAHQTFRWNNEASGKAAVHCVIIGFAMSVPVVSQLFIYEDVNGQPHSMAATNINPYLVDAPDVFLPSRRQPICKVPSAVFGSMPNDGGHFFLDADERAQLLAVCPSAEQWIRPFLGADEFLNNLSRWCLWLVGCPPEKLRGMPPLMERVQRVKSLREASPRAATRALATTPSLFGEIRQPTSEYLLIPCHSSERRNIIPLGFLPPEVICGNANLCLPDATLYHLGALSSRMHMAWVKYVCGRLESRYRYTSQVVYNNFPWPTPSDKQRTAIESTAQAVIDARSAHPNASLADLYDPLSMPPDLVKAHQKLDMAVDAAYGYKGAATDAARVAFLFGLYQQLAGLLPAALIKPKSARHPASAASS